MSKPKTKEMDRNELLMWLEIALGAEDYVDDGRTRRYETWADNEQQAYNQIREIIEQHFGGKDASKE